MDQLHLSIVSPEKELFNGDISSVTLPGIMGRFTILPHHAPIVSLLNAGMISYVPAGGSELTLDVQGGFMEMSEGLVSVCVS